MTAKTNQIAPADLLASIAQKPLFIETLEERKSDSLDFHEVSVWGIQAALEAAYAAGLAAAQEAKY
ncbi:DUF6900 domain-containing protein [Profundibacter sp.]|uniref:DUF6900 domain-containing protein n=1 Tax=Profundibacter sp. TaxID=3101071 RepID=UPI003D0EA4A6